MPDAAYLSAGRRLSACPQRKHSKASVPPVDGFPIMRIPHFGQIGLGSGLSIAATYIPNQTMPVQARTTNRSGPCRLSGSDQTLICIKGGEPCSRSEKYGSLFNPSRENKVILCSDHEQSGAGSNKVWRARGQISPLRNFYGPSLPFAMIEENSWIE